MIAKIILINILPYILYLWLGYFSFNKSFGNVLFFSLFFLLSSILLSIVIYFIIFGKKQKLIIIDYIEGTGGNAAIGFLGTGKIYKFLYKIGSKEYKSQLVYASLFSYEKGKIVNGYKNGAIFVIGKDLMVLTYFGIMLLFPSLKLFS